MKKYLSLFVSILFLCNVAFAADGDPVLIPGSTSITTVGTITTGTWQGDPISADYIDAVYQALDADLTYLASFTPSATVKSILTAADADAIQTILGYYVSGDTIVGTLTGNASTATALAANGANCNAGYAPLGVDASGAVEGCFAVQTALTYPVTGVETPTAGYLTKWDVSGNAIVDAVKIGTFTDTKWCTYTTATGLQCVEAAPPGTGTVIGPESTTQYSIPYWSASSMTLVDGVAPGAANALLYSNGTAWARLATSSDVTSFLGSADYSTMRTNLGLALGVNVQAYNTNLASVAGLTFADASIIQLTAAASSAVLTSGGNNYFLSSTLDNTALEFKTPAATLTAISGQPLHASLTSISDLTETNGGLLYGTADNTYAWLAAGTAGYLLQANGAGAPTWVTALANGFTATTQSAGDNSTKVATTAYANALVSDTAYAASWDTVTGIAPSKNAVYDQFVSHGAAADPHAGYVLESLFDAHTIIYATTDNTPAALTVTEQTLVGRLTSGNISAVSIGIADNNIVQIDQDGAADDEYARFTANGIESRSITELKADVGDAAADGATKGFSTFTANDFDAAAGVISLDYTNAQKASDTQAGFLTELATAAETTTGTDATRAITPDGLAGSDYGKRIATIPIVYEATAIAAAEGVRKFTIPQEINGWNLIAAHAVVYTVSTSGTPTYQIHNLTDGQDMLSTEITIDENEYNSYTAAAAPVIDTDHDDVATGDIIRIDKDVAGDAEKGDTIILTFQKP